MTTFARACPVSLSRNPLSPGIEATPKTDLSLSRSLVHRQTWRLTGRLRHTSLSPTFVISSESDFVICIGIDICVMSMLRSRCFKCSARDNLNDIEKTFGGICKVAAFCLLLFLN